MQYNKDKNYKQIISFLGLSPRVFQSGTSVLESPYMIKYLKLRYPSDANLHDRKASCQILAN